MIVGRSWRRWSRSAWSSSRRRRSASSRCRRRSASSACSDPSPGCQDRSMWLRIGPICGWIGGHVLTALTSPANVGPAPGVPDDPPVDFFTRNENRAIVSGAISMSGHSSCVIGRHTTREISTIRPWNLRAHQTWRGPFGCRAATNLLPAPGRAHRHRRASGTPLALAGARRDLEVAAHGGEASGRARRAEAHNEARPLLSDRRCHRHAHLRRRTRRLHRTHQRQREHGRKNPLPHARNECTPGTPDLCPTSSRPDRPPSVHIRRPSAPPRTPTGHRDLRRVSR